MAMRRVRSPCCASFDHLVGKHQQFVGNVETEGLGALEVDYQLKLGRLEDRQIGRLLSLENAPGIDAALTIPVCETGPVLIKPPAAAYSRKSNIAGIAWRDANAAS
jgi:hypothetical protein